MFIDNAKSIFSVLVVVILTSIAGGARAEDLVMPFSCAVHGNDLHVAPANDTTYRIVGRRIEQPFVACSKTGASCETMMVHRFAIECDGAQIAWSRVTQAATLHGVKVPTGLPAGFAPVSPLSGRFLLPALVSTSAHDDAVAMQDLSPDSVTGSSEDWQTASNGEAQWITEIRSDVLRSSPGGNAGHVAASLGGVLLVLFAASMVAAGRWRMPAQVRAGWAPNSAAGDIALQWSKRVIDAVVGLRSKLEHRWDKAVEAAPSDDLANALLILQARLIEADLAVSSLAPHLLLRDVLLVEIYTIRTRFSELERHMSRRAPQKSAAVVRNLLRELDRIGRIANSAAQGGADRADAGGNADDHDAPQTMADAYRVLGINPDAAPAIAKKLVDALRMSWHPDLARDEIDRRSRESRMKQINAAWDLVKSQRAAA